MSIDQCHESRTFCRFCVAICGLVVTTCGDQVVAVRGDREHPISRGYTCAKGRGAGRMHHAFDRLDAPMLRRDGALVAVGWPEMLDDLATRFAAMIDESGPDAVALYAGTVAEQDSTGAYATRRFFRAMGSASRYTALTLDTPCKPYVAALVAGDARLAPQVDESGAQLTLVIGTNPVASHGHTFAFPDPVRRLRALRQQGEVWVVDPRSTETALLASRHLSIRPGSDYAVIGHVVREMLPSCRAAAADTCTGLDALTRAVEPLDAALVSQLSGLEVSDLADLVAAVRRAGRVAVMTGTGATMAPTSNVNEWLLWSLLAITDSLDQPGGMWFNPGYLNQDDRRDPPAATATVQPTSPGVDGMPRLFRELPCAALASQIEQGRVRALVVVGGNPLASFPQPERLRAAFAQLDVLAVADVLRSDTGAVATHVLPCAGQLERADMPVGLDRAYNAIASQHTAAVIRPAAQRRPLWWIMAELADRLGLSILPGGHTPADCTDELILDAIAGGGRTSVATLRDAPTALVDAPQVFGWIRRRIENGRRWNLAPEPLVAQLEQLVAAGDSRPSLRLVPHRLVRSFNSMEDAWNDPRRDRPVLGLTASDAAAAGLAAGDEAEVRSSSGAVTARVSVDPSLPLGIVTLGHGSQHPNVNALVSDVTDIDALTGMVRLTDVPVTISRTGNA